MANNGGAEALPGDKDGKAAQALRRSIGEVHGVLERNRALIQEIGQNNAAREAGGLDRNVTLIRELNANMARVATLYSGLSSSFSTALDAADAAKKSQGPPAQ